MSEKASLTPTDWIIAGLAALADGGVESVRVERLAKRLGTTKGSFYWHFADRPALLAAMLEFWEREGTTDLIDHVADIADPAERLRWLAADAVMVLMRGVNVARSETAIRAWAAQDPVVGERFARVEAARIDFLVGDLVALGYDEQAANLLAKAIYLALIGLFLVRPYAPYLADDAAFLDLVERTIAAAPGRP